MKKRGRTAQPIAWITEGDCWRCVSHRQDTDGYPRAVRNGKKKPIARHILIHRLGNISVSLVSRHTCDNRWCIRPDHIVHGSPADNRRDMVQRGRSPNFYGENNSQVKLTQEQVNQIRGLIQEGKLLQREIAAKFGITKSHVSAIKLGKFWNPEREHMRRMLRHLQQHEV